MPELTRWTEATDGPLTESAMRARLEALGYRVSRYVYPPGTVFPSHDHAVDKIDGVLSGRLLMRMDGETICLEAGDMLVVPRGVAHSAEVLGDEPVVSLDAVKTG
jgi:quercetin dioxygenase-like cupin family protein